MKFKIYQIDMDRDKNRVKFDNLENTKKHQGFEQIDAGIYDRVFMGDTDSETLEDIYPSLRADGIIRARIYDFPRKSAPGQKAL